MSNKDKNDIPFIVVMEFDDLDGNMLGYHISNIKREINTLDDSELSGKVKEFVKTYDDILNLIDEHFKERK